VILLSGLRFVFEPEDALSPAERAWLAEFERPSETGPPVVTVRLEHHGETHPEPEARSARLAWEEGRVVLRHAAFEAEIDPRVERAVVRRDPRSALGIITTLRTVLSARLPLEGGLVLHAAGLEHGGMGFVCFGPSGIGKTTLAQRSPWPVLSDELVALLPRRRGERHRISGTAFRKPLAGSPPPSTAEPPLAVLIELAQGPGYRLDPLEPGAALRRVLGSITVPPGPPLWAAALAVVGDLVRDVPCSRMEWSLDESPFAQLALAIERLRRDRSHVDSSASGR
jgi:hypothetical protein